MLSANPAIAGIRALFGTLDADFPGQLLPMVIGIAFALGVVGVGVWMSRKRPAGTPPALGEGARSSSLAPAQDDLGQPQPPEALLIQGKNPLWGLVLPGLGLLVLGGAIFWVVIPVYQDAIKARDDALSTMQPANWHLAVPTQPVVLPPIPYQQPQLQFQPPQIQVPPIQPPRIPQPYIDGRGIIRTR